MHDCLISQLNCFDPTISSNNTSSPYSSPSLPHTLPHPPYLSPSPSLPPSYPPCPSLPLSANPPTGTVPLSTLHEWVLTMLPDVAPRIADDSIMEHLFYKNAFTGAATVVEYRKNEVRSDLLVLVEGLVGRISLT
jgi:hypothetical protein